MKSNQPAARIIFALALVLSLLTPASRAADDLNQPIQKLADDLTSSKQGPVASSTENEVYIALGQRDGIVPGNRFEIIRQGDPLTVNGEIIGYKETHIADVEVNKVRDRVSIATYREKTELPKTDDIAYEQRKKIRRLVIAQFSYNQGFNRFTKSLQEKLFTIMSNKGLQVIERSQLERVLKEQKLGYSGLINPASAKKIGQLLGAEGMMLGTVSGMGDSITLNARLVDMETGDTIAASESQLPKTTLIDAMLKAPVENQTTALASASPVKQAKKRKALKKEVDGFLFELIGCKKSGSDVTCDLLITNTKKDRSMDLKGRKRNWVGSSRLFDNFGNAYEASGVWLANCSHESYCKMDLISEVPTKGGLSFDGVDENASSAAVVEIKFYSKNVHTVQFRNVPFTGK